MNQLRILSLLFVCTLTGKTALAQPYLEGKTRHRFAQLTLGASQRVVAPWGSETYTANGNIWTSTGMQPAHETKFHIGGLHFWGHADFYVAIQVARWGRTAFSTGTETGFKYFPWQITSNHVRPFIGFSITPTAFRHEKAAVQQRILYPLQTGLVYNRGSHLLELQLQYNYANRFNYHYDRTSLLPTQTGPLWVTATWKLMLETTLGAEKSWENGKSAELEKALGEKGVLSGLSVAVGASSTWFTTTVPHNEALRPYLPPVRVTSGFLDWGVGYYFHRPDVHLNLAWRRIGLTHSGHDVRQDISRKALTLEAFRYLGDYHGFRPFLGPALSREHLEVREWENDVSVARGSFNGLKPGIIFGWDISPTMHETWLLRTNLRYFPKLDVTMNNGQLFSLDQIEFNFIQWVFYPERWMYFRRK